VTLAFLLTCDSSRYGALTMTGGVPAGAPAGVTSVRKVPVVKPSVM
jgi:hypothetical protein